MTAGSTQEPNLPDVAAQMREVTDRLREQAWTVAASTNPVPEQQERIDADSR